jgi:predicted dehydrogenase
MGLFEVKSSSNDGANVVSIMTPNDSHYEYTIASLENGRNIFCEKLILTNMKISWI